MTFEELKTTILDRVKRLEICEAYQSALIAENKPALIAAAINLIEWTYESGIVDNTLLAEFDDADLNDAGIYKASFSLTNPSMDIYLLAGATGDIFLGEDIKRKIRILGSAELELVMSDNAHAEVKFFGASGSVELVSHASICLTLIRSAEVSSMVTGDSVLHVLLSDQSQLTHEAGGNSYTSIKAYNNAQVSYTIIGDAEIDVRKYQQAVVNEIIP